MTVLRPELIVSRVVDIQLLMVERSVSTAEVMVERMVDHELETVD